MDNFSIIDFIFDLFDMLINFTNAMYNFLFFEINIGDIFKLSVWQLIGGVGMVSLLVAWLIKKIVK